MRTELLEAALRYAGRGWPVFPCEPRGKRPRTRNGLHDATTDRDQIEKWWRADGTANVAVRTGRPAGICVLDVDGDDGRDSLHDLERNNGALPRTASVVTPSGGQHYYFAHPGREIRNSAGALGVGLDIRGDGGYAVVPPSVGPNGRRYEADDRSPIAELPAWLRKLIAQPDKGQPPAATPTSAWVNMVRHGLAEGARNDGLARLCGHLLRRYIDVDLAAELVHLVNARCRPPLPSEEVDRVIESIASRELRRRQRPAA